MENSSMFKRVIQVFIVFVIMFILLAWFGQQETKQICCDFANNAKSKPALMDKTFKAILSVKTIKNFRRNETGYIKINQGEYKDNKLTSSIDWKGIFNDDYWQNNAFLLYKYSPKYEKEVQSGIVRLDMIENVYIGNTRVGLRFIFKRTQQGDIDKNNYGLEAECDLLGDIPRIIKIK